MRSQHCRPFKKEWVNKSENKCNVAFTSLKACSRHLQYFDSRCSRCMTGERNFLEDVTPCDQSRRVTFRDDVLTNILSIGNLCVPDLPKLTNVYLVESLKTECLVTVSVSYAIRISL